MGPAFRAVGLLNYLPQAGLVPAHLPPPLAARLLGVAMMQATQAFSALRPQLRQPVGELSGGPAWLLQTLQLLPAPTAFSLFDEPFSGIMPVYLEALAAEMRRAKDHKGILLTNHYYTAVLPLCDVVYLLHHGRLLRLGPNREAELRDYGYLPAQASQGA